MTRINKIVMHGFKSFARQTELPFEQGFNCVLGPNGAGKSNVLDALCFVLGRLSSKAMRAEKSANLVYNGGKTKKPMKQGEVSIYFDNSKKTFPTDDAEVKITRIIKQSGQSIYKINDKKRTRQQVLDLMSVAKIDPEGYNIVLQGDIVRFAEMHPEERRMLIEEISGISVYEDKRQKAIRELEKVDEKLKEAEVVLAERNRHLQELKKDRDQAMKLNELKERININKASYLHAQIEKEEQKRAELADKISKRKEKLQEIEGRINGLKSAIQGKRQEIEAINREIEEKGEKEQLSLQRDIEGLKIKNATNKTRLDGLNTELEKISLRKSQLKKDLSEHDELLKNLNSELEKIGNERKAVLEEQGRIEHKIEEIKRKGKLEGIPDIDKAMEEIDKGLEAKQAEIDELRKSQQELVRTKDALEFKIKIIDERIEKVKEVEKAHKGQVEELKNKKELFKAAMAELSKRLNEDSDFARQIGEKRERIADVHGSIAKLRARSISVKEETGSVAVKKILEQKIRGVHGTIRHLGSVSSKYALALEIAAGPRINSIVVDDEKVAARCIDYLKQNKLGIATFLPLSKIKERESGEAETFKVQKGVHGIAIEFISFEHRFRKAFSHIFGDTLVVDDIGTAIKLGVGRARMVTLDGDLSEHSGAMQGGFRHLKGRLGFSEVEVIKELEEQESIAEEFEKSLKALEKQREANEGIISQLRERRASLEGEIIKQEKSLHLEDADLGSSVKEKNRVEEELKSACVEMAKAESKIGEINRQIIELKTKKSGMREKINELRNPEVIAEISAFEEQKKKLNDRFMKLDVDIRSISTRIKDIILPEKERINSILKQQDKEAENFRKESEELNKKIDEGRASLEEQQKKATEFYAKHRSLLVRRTRIEDEIQKDESCIDEAREKGKTEEIEMNKLILVNAEVSAKLAGLTQEFQQFEGVKIDKSKSEEDMKKEIEKFERRVIEIGNVNMRALEIYEDIEKEYNGLLGKKEKLIAEKGEVLKMMAEIEGRKKELFMRTFDAINENFKSMFSALSTKGDATLMLENPDNPFVAGLNIRVRLVGHKFLDIRSLSGGEKTMTALAFIFSIQEYEPHSFYILDEVDAALDKHNSEKLAKLLRKYAEKAQYVIISHNDAIMSEADTLYGVSMDEHGISKVTSLKV